MQTDIFGVKITQKSAMTGPEVSPEQLEVAAKEKSMNKNKRKNKEYVILTEAQNQSLESYRGPHILQLYNPPWLPSRVPNHIL